MSSQNFWERLRRRLSWNNLGFSADESNRFNDAGLPIFRGLLPVVVMKPSDGTFPDAAAGTDPIAKLGDVLDVPYSIATKSNPVFVSLQANLASDAANPRYMTMEEPVGTDYQVPSGKELYILKIFYANSTANVYLNWGYGDTAVAEGISAPTNATLVLGSAVATGSSFLATAATTTYEFKVYAKIPASKYPFFAKTNVASIAFSNVIGLEVTV